jgi:isopropylmalate/homocitrate/citramalate synthase
MQKITIVEVGPRDGLQNEAARVETAAKIGFVERLAAAGLPVVEVSSFVRADRVPQLADAAEVFAGVARRAGTRYTALVPNVTGLRAAIAAGVSEVAIFAAASETFSQRNTNRSIAQSLVAFDEVCRAAAEAGVRVRGYVSTAFGCPFEGAVDPAQVARLSRQLVDLGVFEIAVSDTIGVAHPGQVPAVVEAVARDVPIAQIALHFHDTRGQALANVMAALPLGVRTFDASAGGLGGCPFAPGATGNLATEDLLYMLSGLGYETGVSLPGVVEASMFIEPAVGHALPSRTYRALRQIGGK